MNNYFVKTHKDKVLAGFKTATQAYDYLDKLLADKSTDKAYCPLSQIDTIKHTQNVVFIYVSMTE